MFVKDFMRAKLNFLEGQEQLFLILLFHFHTGLHG